jgi:DNA-binding response OmpR family regulator
MPKIMVVDDEPDVVHMIENMLKSYHMEVVTAYDGIGAIDLAEQERPDLILLDIMMPMMSGYEVCEQLKGNPQTKDIPIVCVSSGHSLESRTRSRSAGAAALMVKPFSPAELIAQINAHLDPAPPVPEV